MPGPTANFNPRGHKSCRSLSEQLRNNNETTKATSKQQSPTAKYWCPVTDLESHSPRTCVTVSPLFLLAILQSLRTFVVALDTHLLSAFSFLSIGLAVLPVTLFW